MGQYFKPANLDKREYICPWCIGGGAKFFEWAANTQGAIFTMLLHRSDETSASEMAQFAKSWTAADDGAESEDDSSRDLLLCTGIPGSEAVPYPYLCTVGGWAGDRVVLIGDGDSSGLYGELEKFTNISEAVVRDWNAVLPIPDLQLKLCDDCYCRNPFE
ncbi:MAG TPA: hypothetical protein PLY87_05630 [Planctomycetaceae bacterium]|nr:hypothetical protein [Planctomycetaceae bacterium]